MINFETYLDTVTPIDSNGVQYIPTNKSVIYSGSLSKVVKEKERDARDIPPMAAAVIGLKNTAATTAKTASTSLKSTDYWTDIDAQESYLDSKPTCYLILSKPGTGVYSLGEALSKKLNCVHLCPKNVLIDEMEQGSNTGKCIGFNLQQQNVMKFDIILSLIKKKIESPAVRHRGYVLSGIPLISTDRKLQCLSNSLYSEEGLQTAEDLLYDVFLNLKKKKRKHGTSSPRTSMGSHPEEQGEEEAEEEQDVEELGEEEEEELIVALPKFILNSCSDVIFRKKPSMHTKQSIFLDQLTSIFNLAMTPDIIIYLTCPDKDLVIKRCHKYYNYKNNTYIFDSFPADVNSDLRWPAKAAMSEYTSPYNSHTFNSKYNCRKPINFTHNCIEQLCNYGKYVLPYVDDKLKDFKPKYVIKLDARTTVHQMMHNLNEKLLFLSIKPVLIPEPLYMEEPPEEMEEFWKLVEETNIISSGVTNFNRYPSLWLNRCPVELKKRRSQRGNPKLAVKLFKHVYLLSSLDNMISFCRNPRPYLKLKYLEPTCRVIVMGTQKSGKTMISHCLSWIFDTPITNYEVFLEAEKEKKYNTYAKTILSEIIAIIEDTRLSKWQDQETERLTKLVEWDKTYFEIFQTYVSLVLDLQELLEARLTIEEEEESENQESGRPETQLRADIEYLKNRLSFMPYLEDIDECMIAIRAKTLIQFAPLKLSTVTQMPMTPILGDTDVTIAISNYIATNDLQKEIEPTNEELINEICKILSDKDELSLQNDGTYGKFIIDGFPSDPEFWDGLRNAKLLPDHTIALIENREINSELAQYYERISNCYKNHDERIALANDPLIEIKVLTKPFPENHLTGMRNIINQLVDTIVNVMQIEASLTEDDNKDNSKSDFAGSFTVAIDKFREDWDSVKLKLEECSKFFIEIEIENKTDIEIIEEVLIKLRKNYYLSCVVNEEEVTEPQDDEDETPKDILTYNNPRNLCETSVYCPIAFYDYGVLWEGKPELCVKYDNKLYYFSKEECSESFQKEVSLYQAYNKPFKSFSPFRICVVGCIGSGKTTISKLIAKELGLLHLDFSEIINTLLMPRHYKKVGREYENIFTDIPIDEEGVSDFQIDEENENLAFDLLGNEMELRRMIYNYFERGAPILSALMKIILKKLWFEEPFVNTGFVLDGFPRLPSDAEDMVACFSIPDLIIELEGSSEIMLQRLSQKMFKTWRDQLNEAKLKAKLKLDKEIEEWMKFITKNVVVKLIIEDILDNTLASEEDPTKRLSAGSVIMDTDPQGSPNVEVNLFTFYNNMIKEFPAPTDLSEWEKSDEARERIDTRLESVYEEDDAGIQSLKDVLLEQRIKITTINGTKPINKVLRLVLYKLKNLRSRCISFLEQTLVVGSDIAEMLLSEGFYCISKFNRMCPVYIYENPTAILNPFQIMKRKDKIFPVIHRAFIYFIFEEEGLKKFRTNPLKYVGTDVMKSFKEYPLTVSVIGPPKSGKTVLANKLAKRYGLIYISRGVAIRYILENMYWTELGSRMKSILSKGECVGPEEIIKAVQTVTIDHRTTMYGFVFDGFPENAIEAMELTNIGLYPNFVFDISNDVEFIMYQSLNEIYHDILKRKPPYSAPYIYHRYTNWSQQRHQIRDWVQQDVQNIFLINGKNSRWQCLQDATTYIEDIIPKINYYLNNVADKIVLMSCMCISDEVFYKRMSHFKNMCPFCLKCNILRHSSHPIDKKGVVQFKNKFYWICPNHLSAVLKHPEQYLAVKKVEIPEIPAVVKTVNITFVYENGICIVTYAQNLPAQRIVMGTHEYAASFKGKTYMFCSAKCLDDFLAKPHMYHDITVFKETNTFPQLKLRKLPHLGYLEQTIGNVITDACCAVNVLRPKYPGLDIKTSGAIYIGLYLKTHNTKTEKSVALLYDKASVVYDARCKLILDLGLFLRSMDNPFANYPKCCAIKSRYLDSGTVGKQSSNFYEIVIDQSAITDVASRVPVPDERYDYLVEYHKPASKVPAFLNIVDIAGLVRGAAEGQGLGNAFLSHIKACDAIFNLCRAFDDEDVIHVDGDVNPVRDLETIGEELRLKDEEELLKNIEKLDRVVNRGGEKKLKPEYDALMKIKAILVDEKKHIRFGDWSAADIEVLNKYLFLTSKPALYLVNLSEKDYIRKKNKWLPKLKEWIDKNDPGAPLIPFSGVLETKLMDMEPAERQAFLKENNLTSALDKIIVQGYKALQLEYFFTAGADEVKAWTIQKGTKAPQAAGRIHTDFEKGFIMAEVMHFKDFREEGTEAACKAAGKYRQQGRNYVVENGDIIFFKFNAGAGLKDAKKK